MGVFFLFWGASCCCGKAAATRSAKGSTKAVRLNERRNFRRSKGDNESSQVIADHPREQKLARGQCACARARFRWRSRDACAKNRANTWEPQGRCAWSRKERLVARPQPSCLCGDKARRDCSARPDRRDRSPVALETAQWRLRNDAADSKRCRAHGERPATVDTARQPVGGRRLRLPDGLRDVRRARDSRERARNRDAVAALSRDSAALKNIFPTQGTPPRHSHSHLRNRAAA